MIIGNLHLFADSALIHGRLGWSENLFNNSAISKHVVQAYIVVEMGAGCWVVSITQLLSRPKVSKSHCVISHEPFLCSVRTPSSTASLFVVSVVVLWGGSARPNFPSA